MRWVDRVGIELEGGWRELWPFGKGEDPKLVADDSLPSHLVNGVTGENCAHTGEKTSPPLEPEKVAGWMTKYYPDETNDRCGLHVHVSLTSPQAYSILGSLAFYQFFLAEMEKWGVLNLKETSVDYKQFFSRLQGWNKYCILRMDPYEQMKAKNKAEARRAWLSHSHQLRRTHLNFPYTMLRTVECRLFPMFLKSPTAISAVEAFMKTCEDWVEQNISTFETRRSYRIVVKGPMSIKKEAR